VVNQGDAVEKWNLIGAQLDVAPGAQTDAIVAAYSSALNIDSAEVRSNATAINVLNSDTFITDSTVTSTGGTALTVNRNGDFIEPASAATVVNSTLSGVGRSVIVSFESQLGLSNTVIDNTANGSGVGVGILMLDGLVEMENNTRVTGAVNGVQMGREVIPTSAGTGSLSVDGSTITGVSGSAILVAPLNSGGRATEAQIDVFNGSTLQGGNGLSIEVRGNSNVEVTVDQSRLIGGIFIEDGATATVALDHQSSLSGDVTNVADLSLNNGSTLSGNLTGTTNLNVDNNSSITGNVDDVVNFTLGGNSSVSGNISNVADLSLNNGSTLSGNLIGTTNLNVDNNSSITGNVDNVVNFTLAGNSSVNGNLNNIENLSLDNSTWTTSSGSGVTNLSMNAGTVKLGAGDGTFETLNVSTLSGNGRFIMDTDLAAHQGDLLNVSGVASGNYDLQIKNTGAEPITGDQDQRVVHTGAGSTAGFGVVGGQVDVGTFAYELQQRDDDWYLVQKVDEDGGGPITTPGTRSVIGLFSAAPTVWYGELSSLRSRMGELRYGKTQGGGWMRSYGNKYNLSAAGGTAYQQNQTGISLGADAPLPTSNGQWLVGVLGGYSRSDLDITAGTSGRVDSYYIGGYTTWLSDEGWYVDAILKANRFKNKSDVRMSDGTKASGDYNTSGVGASVEAGKHIKLQDDWFVEPFAQVSTLWVDGKSYSLDNGMDASSNKADSILGKVGTTVGRNFPLDKGGFVQPYVKVAMAQEFAKSNRVKVNSTTFSNDLSGSRGEIGAGIAAQVSDVLQLHADVDYSNGENIEQPWGVNVGLRYSW
jgi:outer membrane autotransporter protein